MAKCFLYEVNKWTFLPRVAAQLPGYLWPVFTRQCWLTSLTGGQSQVPTLVVSAGLSGALATCHSRPRTRQGLNMMDLVPDIVLEVGGFKNLC